MSTEDPPEPRVIRLSTSLPMESAEFDNRRAFEETRNPIFAWDQMHLARRANQPIPDWCLPVLDNFLSELFAAKSLFLSDKLSWKARGLKLAAMIGLSLGDQGKLNAVKDQDRWFLRATDALHPSRTGEWAARQRRENKKLWRWIIQ